VVSKPACFHLFAIFTAWLFAAASRGEGAAAPAIQWIAAIALGACVALTAGVWSPPAQASDLLAAGSAAPPRPGPIATGFPLRFDSEIIHLRIVGDSLEVDGTYFLACQLPYDQPISLFYPFPKDSLLAGARMVDGRARIGDGPWEALRFQALPGRNGVRWWVPACPGDTIEMQGRYRQGLRETYARYIVTTTRAWQQPLRHARFEIRLPDGAEPVKFSFPFVAERDSTGVVYVWETDSFYPDRDITVRWR
jgi:hypothetical protein